MMIFAQGDAKNHDTIVESHLAGGHWTAPVAVPFSGKYQDMDPVFSPDGTYAIFSSLRPLAPKKGVAANLWRVDRTAAGWGTPVKLPPSVNDGAFNVAPSIARDGTLYFLHIRNHLHELYRAALEGSTYATATPLAFSAGEKGDYDPGIAPDQSFLVFASTSRNGSSNIEHLYISSNRNGTWSTPRPLRYAGDYAAPGNDASPLVSADGRTLFFSSDRKGNFAWKLPLDDTSGDTR